MVSELDIYRAANLLIERHRTDAVIEAAKMIDRMLDRADTEGWQVWRRIKRAIEAFRHLLAHFISRSHLRPNTVSPAHHRRFGAGLLFLATARKHLICSTLLLIRRGNVQGFQRRHQGDHPRYEHDRCCETINLQPAHRDC